VANGITKKRWKDLLDRVRRDHLDLWQPWFAGLSAGELNNGQLCVHVDDEDNAYYLDSSCRLAFADAAQAVLGRLVSVEFIGPEPPTEPVTEPAKRQADAAVPVGAQPTNVETSPSPTSPSDGVLSAATPTNPVAAVRPVTPLVQPAGTAFAVDEPVIFNPAYSFENFITGPGNRLAHAAAVAVADNPGTSYNPLFIHGSVGLGKTHLLQAICQGILAKRPDCRICYLSCDSFINHFIASVEQGVVHNFRFRYRHVDVLVIDDIHFLAERERTQDEFFHTFNTLYQGQKQIVLSCDCPPGEIPDLEERLVSRFSWGLVARIDPPTYETRVAILRRKARLRGMDLPEDVCCYIAARVESNIREIEGALTKVVMTAQVQGSPLTLEVARSALGGPDEEASNKEISIQQIMDAVVDRYNVRMADLQSKKRTHSIAFPRQICMYIARKLTRHSLEEIGNYFGGRDHTTVLHACRAVTLACEKDPQLDATLRKLAEAIQQGSYARR
jgi:chromosomal replication initiator protein